MWQKQECSKTHHVESLLEGAALGQRICDEKDTSKEYCPSDDGWGESHSLHPFVLQIHILNQRPEVEDVHRESWYVIHNDYTEEKLDKEVGKILHPTAAVLASKLYIGPEAGTQAHYISHKS